MNGKDVQSHCTTRAASFVWLMHVARSAHATFNFPISEELSQLFRQLFPLVAWVMLGNHCVLCEQGREAVAALCGQGPARDEHYHFNTSPR